MTVFNFSAEIGNTEPHQSPAQMSVLENVRLTGEHESHVKCAQSKSEIQRCHLSFPF